MNKGFFGILVLSVFVSCHSSNKESLKMAEQLKFQVDSISAVYATIQWSEWEALYKKVDTDVNHVSELIDQAIKMDTGFISYYGPYSTSGKIIGRILRKSKSKLEEEIAYSKSQLQHLITDIQSGKTIPVDSVPLYMDQESQAVEKLVFEISTLVATLNEQKEAYTLTSDKVHQMIGLLKQKYPEIFISDVEYKFNEEVLHE